MGWPAPPLGLAALIEAHGTGLGWLLGILERWPELPEPSRAAWRILGLSGAGSPRAALLGQPHAASWWALVARDPADAARLLALPELAHARSLSLDADLWAGVHPLTPRLAARITSAREVAALSRPAEPHLPAATGVRRAAPGDVDALGAFPITVGSQPLREARAILVARARRGEVWVRVDGGMVVAMAEALAAGPRVDIQRVHVLPEARRRGHARALVGGICRDAALRGLSAGLCVEPDNPAALALYHGLGFVPVGRRVDLSLGQARPTWR